MRGEELLAFSCFFQILLLYNLAILLIILQVLNCLDLYIGTLLVVNYSPSCLTFTSSQERINAHSHIFYSFFIHEFFVVLIDLLNFNFFSNFSSSANPVTSLNTYTVRVQWILYFWIIFLMLTIFITVFSLWYHLASWMSKELFFLTSVSAYLGHMSNYMFWL